jgi:ketosteroid isomerase-like protein
MTENQPIAPDELPDTVTRYLSAHRAHDTAAAISEFTNDATVIDDGNTYNGAPAVENWLNRSSTEYTYTVELTGAHKADTTHYTATNRLEGNFPGGIVDLHYKFSLCDGRIEHLVITP